MCVFLLAWIFHWRAMQRARLLHAGGLMSSGRVQLTCPRVAFGLRNRPITSLRPATDAWWALSSALRMGLCFASSFASAASRPGQRSHYRSLGIDTDATPAEVKAAYRQLALRYHPDVAAEEHRAQSEVLFRRVSEAYEVLSDPVKRRAHDNELGIQTRRRQTTTAPPAAAAAGSTSSTSPLHGTTARSTSSSADTARRRRKRRAAGVSGTAQQQQQQESRRYRKPFVRGDANRVFADAFDGKTLDEILFDVQRRRRQAATAAQRTDASSSSSFSSSSSSMSDGALDRDARLRHVMEAAAESFAHKAQQQYGHGVLRHIRARASPLPQGPSPPPGAYMPFRPFVKMAVPAGVQTPPEPQLGRVLTPQEATIEEVTGTQEGDRGAVGVPAQTERVAPQFHTHHYADGTPYTRMASLRKATKDIEGMPHNMGQLYSYQRPY